MEHKYSRLTLIVIIIVAAFLYGYNLYATVPFDGDTARDTLIMLQIWQEKRITLLGAPLSLGYGTATEMYFSSLPNYVGLLGLLVARFNPVGASLPNMFLLLLSIPFFWLLVKKLSRNALTPLLATLIYAWNPLTVNQARFFWNPNLLIPLSTFFWYFISIGAMFWAGIIIGIMFNFHYLGVIGGVLYAIYLVFKRFWSKLARYLAGAIIGSAPILIFELRNNFYLSKTLLRNIQNSSGDVLARTHINPIVGSVKLFLTQLGVISGDLYYPIIGIFSERSAIVVAVIMLALLIYTGIRIWRVNPPARAYLVIFIFATVIVSIMQMANFTRYMWGMLPLSTWLLAESLVRTRSKLIVVVIMGFMLGSSFVNVLHNSNNSTQTLSLAKLENISNTIIEDNPTGRYNISESFIGDARFVALRYFLLRDAAVKPQDVSGYHNLDRLYILALDADHAMDGGRWEFIATPDLTLTEAFPVNGLVVARYDRIRHQ